MAAGKVCTGFSKPIVAKYTKGTSGITYSDGQLLGRGVSISASADQADDNNFYADNIIAETESGVFTSGELSMTIDGLLQSAERMIMGLPTANTTTGLMAYDDDQQVPDIGTGVVARFMSDGVTTYTPVIFPRTTYKFPGVDAATQEENIDWQTQELTATIKRAEDEKRTWKYVGGDLTSEKAAENVIRTFFSMTTV